MTEPQLSAEQRLFQVASVLLQYPDEAVREQLPVLRTAVRTLPAAMADPLGPLLDRLGDRSAAALTAEYVATFDLSRKRCLYLTYYAYGDTRRRGMALLRFSYAYRSAGLQLGEGELPDYLPVVLEFAATGDGRLGKRLLTEHRGGLELLRRALHDHGSPYAGVLDALSAALPPIGARELATVAQLAREGPPAEEVGLEPFAPPEYLGGRP